MAREFSRYNFIQNEIVLSGFLCYFIGMIISRFGSVIIEPILKKINFLKFEDYKNYVIASKKDTKIELLSEVNNTYRTICSMCVILIILNIYSVFNSNKNVSFEPDFYIIISIILIMFLFAYRKQTNYITKRIQSNI
jgi:hypothetical protein